ncbi:MAG: bifunctional [glutamine synthetase] adenylyltransferase/[glutamine synthetase]-adenylyl-L-tyrosine phosphorylase [Arachnia sp.]
MARVQTMTGEFARRGFDSPSSAARIWEKWRERIKADPPLRLDDVEAAADRDLALEGLATIAQSDPERFQAMVADPAWLSRVIAVLGCSNVLARFLSRHPVELDLLRVAPTARGAAGWHDFMAQRAGDASDTTDDLRRANLAGLVEIASRDMTADDPIGLVPAIARELSHLADAILDHALGYARREVIGSDQVRLAILAMGKAGAQELNYISDVDVVYVAEPVEGAAAGEAIQIGARVAGAVARICSAHTPEGSIWQVDAALRPEGKAGPLVRTLESSRAYYTKWAKNWEFQAMLKARPAAGDLELGQQFCNMIGPLVWEAGQRPGFLPEVRAMRQRVISLIPPKQVDREIKLGPGGLRDTEFSVQLLQLVHGRADERLRSRGTFEGLDALVTCGYIGRADGAEMGDAYRLQRLLEHRIQLRRLRRTHLVPMDDEAAIRQLARGLGLGPDELLSQWRESTRLVQRLQHRLFFSPLLDAVSTISTDSLRLSPEAAQTRIRALGFTDPRAALGHLEALTKGSSRTAEIQRQLLPAMLSWFAEGPNPDFGLLAFRQLSESLGSTSWYLRALRDEGFMARRLARISSSSRYVVDLLKRAPAMVQMLASTEELEPRSVEQLTDAMTRAAKRSDDLDGAVASVRAMRRAELCRIALSDVLGDIDLATSATWLSALASASIDAALALARRQIDAPPIGVIALGRWGGNEMSYSSDADAMFVASDDVAGDWLGAATALVRRAGDILGSPGPDPALQIDSDLRPEGRGGPLVRTVTSYAAYYGRWSSTWEAQALLRGRHGAGEAELTGQVLAAVDPLRYPAGGVSPAQVKEIRKLKLRMESERIPRGVPKERHLKLGQGGLSDVEWTVQLLQLRHGAEFGALRTTSTLDALAACLELQLVSRGQAHDLREAWLRASRLRNAIMLVRGRPSDSLPADVHDLASVGDLVGYHHGQTSQLLDDTRRLMRRAHRVTETLFWDS